MTVNVARLTVATTLAVLAAALVPRAPDAAAPASRMVYLRGPEDPDCPAELKQARARGDMEALYLTEVMCRVASVYKCAAVCKGDELLVTHVTTRIQRDGKPGPTQVLQKSESPSHDELALKSIKTGGPLPTPPQALMDAAGAVALKLEFVCDCLKRPKTPAPPPAAK
jgi:hypothetical protein